VIFALDLIFSSKAKELYPDQVPPVPPTPLYEFFTKEFKTFFVFLIMEAIVLGSALFANALFLFARHFMTQQTSVSKVDSAHHAESDFLECRQIEIGLLSAWVTQLCASIFILIHELIFPQLTNLHFSSEWEQYLYLITGLESL
jgi:hypothetical protein